MEPITDHKFIEFPFADFLLVFISIVVGYVVTEFFAGWARVAVASANFSTSDMLGSLARMELSFKIASPMRWDCSEERGRGFCSLFRDCGEERESPILGWEADSLVEGFGVEVRSRAVAELERGCLVYLVLEAPCPRTPGFISSLIYNKRKALLRSRRSS